MIPNSHGARRPWLGLLLAACVAIHVGAAPAASGTPYWWPWPERHADITGTWFDTFNFLDLIPGPPFLLIFTAYAALVILGVRFARNLLIGSVSPAALLDANGRVPFRYKPNYLEVAYLRGGRSSVVEAALCNLLRLRVIRPDLGLRRERGSLGGLHSVERAVAQACANNVSGHHIVRDSYVSSALDKFVAHAREKLRLLGFLPTGLTYGAYALAALSALLLVDGLGYIRLQRSLMRGYHNVELLILLMAVAGIGALALAYPRWSGAGRRYLSGLRSTYRPVMRATQAHSDPAHDAQLIFAIAACGAAALDGTGYAAVHEALRPPRHSYSDGGCGGGGCGGGGCGGGGCGGGGCGGGGCGGG